jgi:predicted MFS family arabinose efflux permease
MLSLFTAGGLVGTSFTVAADHVSRRFLASAGAAVMALSLLGFGISPWFSGLLVAIFAWGAAGDAFTSGADVALVDVSGEHLTNALGRQNFLAAIGDLLSPVVLVVAGLARIGWRWLFIGSAVMMFGYSWWLGSVDVPPPEPDDERSVRGSLLEVLRDRRVWSLAAVETLLSLIDEPYLAFLILFLEQVRRAPAPVALTVTLADLVGSAIGSYLAPRLLQRSRLALPTAGLALAAGTALLVLTPSLPLQYAAAAAVGVCTAVIWVAIQGRTLGLRPGQAGTTAAVTGTIALLALPFPWIVGAVADHRGLLAAMSLYVAAAGLLAVLLGGISHLAGTRRGTED